MDQRNGRGSLALVFVLSITLAGCGPGATGGPPSPSGPGPSSTPTPSSGSAAFELTVVPTQFVGRIHSGSQVVLLAAVDGSPSDGPVAISAYVDGGQATVQPEQLLPGAVAEVRVSPPACPSECSDVGARVRIVASRGQTTREEARVLTLVPDVDQLEDEARAHLAPFVEWLAANRPDLGITAATTWEGVPASWVLIVEHYLFFSKDWELDISWHVMIAPNDWSTIVLRRRGTELKPSLAFQIDSVSGRTVPHEIQAPDAVWR